ncbi:peroxiredoxin-like family protein [Tenacibaculum maritimum]|uniref:peroxiredoxin-like family protein n=1 Tax=Tenacibaculum maritimum TaxID=107401 RepID=UPI0038766F2B
MMSLSKILANTKEISAKSIPLEQLTIMQNSTKALKDVALSKKAIQSGNILPVFNLVDATSKPVSLDDFKSDFLVVSFYRGGWCPYCNLELKALQDIIPQLKELGADLVAISPETPDNSLSTSEKNKLTFSVLSDLDNTYAKSIGLVFKMPEELREVYHSFNLHVDQSNGNKDYELPMPATFIVNKQREIIYSFAPEDYTERLDPEIILDVLKKQPVS